MPGIIQRPTKEPLPKEKPERHAVLLRLDEEDTDKLLFLCRIGDTDQNDILRQLIRFAYHEEAKNPDKSA